LTVNGSDLTFSKYFKDMMLIFQLCYGPQFLVKNTIIEVTNWSFDENSIERRKRQKIDEETAKQQINKELKKVVPELQDNLKLIFVDAKHIKKGFQKKDDYGKTKFKAEMDELESFLESVDPYRCDHEAFPGVKGLFQTINSYNVRIEKEHSEEIEKSRRRIKIESFVQLVCLTFALLLMITLFFLNWRRSPVVDIFLSCILMFGLGALIYSIIKLCQTKDVHLCGTKDVEIGKENCENNENGSQAMPLKNLESNDN